MFCLFLFCGFALGQMQACPDRAFQQNAPYSATTRPSRPSCVGVAEGRWETIPVRGGFVVDAYCFQSNAYTAVNPENNYGTVQNVRTRFCALRFDPDSLTVDVGDLTFSSTTIAPGQTFDAGRVTYNFAPYGAVGDCSHTVRESKIDLSETPFQLSTAQPAFTTTGFQSTGGAEISSPLTVVRLTVSAYCGWTGPSSSVVGNVNNGKNTDYACTSFGFDLVLDIKGGSANPPKPCPVSTPRGQYGRCGTNRTLAACVLPSTTTLATTTTTETLPTTVAMTTTTVAMTTAATTATATIVAPSMAETDIIDFTDDLVGVEDEMDDPDWLLPVVIAVPVGGCALCALLFAICLLLSRKTKKSTAPPTAPPTDAPANISAASGTYASFSVATATTMAAQTYSGPPQSMEYSSALADLS
jgi:hypothetical protein